MSNGQLTRQGFLTMNQMEADDNEGDDEELWITLDSMGFNKALFMDEVSHYKCDSLTDSVSVMHAAWLNFPLASQILCFERLNVISCLCNCFFP